MTCGRLGGGAVWPAWWSVAPVAAALMFVAASAAVAVAGARPKCLGRTAQIAGTDRSETLVGTPRADVIAGLGGDDVIEGRGGNDVVCGDGGSNVLIGGAGDDRIAGGPRSDVLAGGDGRDRLAARSGADLLGGGEGDDVLNAGTGPDVVSGAVGNDVLAGGRGADVASFAGAGAGVRVDLRRGFASGDGRDRLRSFESVIGGSGDDVLLGDARRNALSGRAGDDRVLGGGGADLVSGDAGNDGLYGGPGRDLVTFAGSGSAVRVDLANESARGEGRDRLRGLEDAQGSRRDDVIRGDDRANELLGFAGDDVVDGRGGFDVASFADRYSVTADLSRGRAEDEDGFVDRLRNVEGLLGPPGTGRLTGDDGPNLLAGGAGGDSLAGMGGDDRLLGHDGGDLLDGGGGNDDLDGGADSGTARDKLDFSAATSGVTVDLAAGRIEHEGVDVVAGVEEVLGSPEADRLVGGPRGESIEGGGGEDVVDGGAGFDRIRGGDGNDALAGGDWDDEVTGDRGEDRLDGGPGNDVLLGGDGSTFAEPAEADELFGGEGGDLLYGEQGDDALDGGPGVDAALNLGLTTGDAVEADLEAGFYRAEGNDAVAGIEVIVGAVGDNVMRGDEGRDYLLGTGTGTDVLEGRGGDDVLQTDLGDDAIAGREGDDHIVTGDGDDDADGGAGDDECWYAEVETACEADETTTRRPGFDPPYHGYRWNGYIGPRAISAHETEDGVVGTLTDLTGGLGCSRYLDVTLERLSGGTWTPVRTRLASPRYSFEIPSGGTYRVRALARSPSTDGIMCEGVASEPFELAV